MASLADLAPDDMTDTGMWIWAGLITVLSLAVSYGIALWYQRWRDRKAAK